MPANEIGKERVSEEMHFPKKIPPRYYTRASRAILSDFYLEKGGQNTLHALRAQFLRKCIRKFFFGERQTNRIFDLRI